MREHEIVRRKQTKSLLLNILGISASLFSSGHTLDFLKMLQYIYLYIHIFFSSFISNFFFFYKLCPKIDLPVVKVCANSLPALSQ